MGKAGHEVWVTVNGERFLVKVEDLSQNPVIVYVEGARFEVALEEDQLASGIQAASGQPQGGVYSIPAGTSCEVTAPMPGDIAEILVKVGQIVKKGEPLCVLDAMKMKNTIHAPQAGSIAEICVEQGQSVEFGIPLFRMGD